MGNAVKFTERGGVTITAEASATALRLAVIDTGIGIAADQLPHVFDEFRQVEDNADNMRTICALLHETCTIHRAQDGETCLDQARDHKPDIVLLDLSLPGMDGFAVLSAIREDEELRSIPVVAVTARAMKGDREEILASGFDGYVSKPIDDAALENVIQELLHDS